MTTHGDVATSSFVRHLNIPMFGFRIFGRQVVAGSQNDRLAARWPDANRRQFRPSQLGDVSDVFSPRQRKLRKFPRRVNRSIPPGHFFIDRFAIGQLDCVARWNIQPFPVQLISNANANRIDTIQSVQIGDGDLVDPVDHSRVTSGHRVEPTAPAFASRCGAKFASEIMKHLRNCASSVGNAPSPTRVE